jgi:hypothetical protein
MVDQHFLSIFFFSFSLFAALSGHEIDVPGKMSQK